MCPRPSAARSREIVVAKACGGDNRPQRARQLVGLGSGGGDVVLEQP
jgi:hypothetical protein